MQPHLPRYLTAVVAAIITLGCGMPQGVSVVESPNPRAMAARAAFALMPVAARPRGSDPSRRSRPRARRV